MVEENRRLEREMSLSVVEKWTFGKRKCVPLRLGFARAKQLALLEGRYDPCGGRKFVLLAKLLSLEEKPFFPLAGKNFALLEKPFVPLGGENFALLVEKTFVPLEKGFVPFEEKTFAPLEEENFALLEEKLVVGCSVAAALEQEDRYLCPGEDEKSVLGREAG